MGMSRLPHDPAGPGPNPDPDLVLVPNWGPNGYLVWVLREPKDEYEQKHLYFCTFYGRVEFHDDIKLGFKDWNAGSGIDADWSETFRAFGWPARLGNTLI